MDGSRRWCLAVLAIAAWVAGPAEAWAQGGVLRGRVVVAGSGVPVPAAAVHVEGPVAASTTASTDGTWRLGPLPPGRYVVRVESVGYIGFAREVRLASGDEAMLEALLTPRALPLDELVVTASRRTQALADVPVATELVTRTEVEASGASDLAAVLVERTGIQLEGGPTGGAGIMLQGLGSERVLVLLDGQAFIGRISGRIDLSRIPTAMIERVEVVKGPQSTLYGSEAMGGVVNVITRATGRSGWSAGAEFAAGSQDRLDVAANVLGGVGRFGYLADLGRRTMGVAPGRPGESGALAERWDGLAKVDWRPSEEISLEAGALLIDERQRWRSGQLYHFADNVQSEARFGGSWTRGTQRLAPLIRATEFRHLSRQGTAAEPVEGAGEEETQRLVEAELVYGARPGGHLLDLGIEARREEIRSDRVVGRDRAQHTLEPFAQVTFTGDRWSLVPGLRFSWSETWGSYWTPRLAALYRPLPSLSLRAAIAHGYRAPAFKELHMEFLNVGPGFGYVVRGNSELRPETSTNVTAGAEWSGDRVYLRGQLFHNRFDDFIETRMVGDSGGVVVYTYDNIADGTTQGIELEAGATWGGVRAEAGYAYLRARGGDSDEPLLGRPAHSARATLSYARVSGLRASASAVYTGTTPVARTEAGTTERAGFLRFDLRVAQHLPHGFRVFAGIDNVLDEAPVDWPGFARRHIYAGLSWSGSGGGD